MGQAHDGNASGIVPFIRLPIGLGDLFKACPLLRQGDRLRLLDLLERLGLLNTPQTVIQTVQKALKSAWMGELLVPVALLYRSTTAEPFPP